MTENMSLKYVIGRIADGPDALATGGMRRPDGTLSAQVRDLRYLSDEEVSRLMTRATGSSSPGRAVAEQLGAYLLAVTVESLLRDLVVPGTTRMWRERLAPAVRRMWAHRRGQGSTTRQQDSVQGLEEEGKQSAHHLGLTAAENSDPTIHLSSEEAAWHIKEAQRAARELAEHMTVLRVSRVVDEVDMLAMSAGQGQLAHVQDTAMASSSSATDELREPAWMGEH